MFLIFILGILILIGGIIAGFCMKNHGWSVAGVVVCVILVIVSCISSVPTGYTGILTTFGAVADTTLPNGLNWHAPWQKVVAVSNKEQTFTETNLAFSADLQEVKYTYTVKYSLAAENTPTIYREIGSNYFNVLIKPQVNNAIKTQLGLSKAELMTTQRVAIQNEINNAMRSYASVYGISIQVFLDDFDFTDLYTDAIEAKQVAEQEALRDKTQQQMETERASQQAERARIQAESAAEVAKIQAQSNYEVAQLEADAVAYRGQKEAEAKAAMAEVMTDTLIDYEYASRWDGVLPKYMGGDSTPIMDMRGE